MFVSRFQLIALALALAFSAGCASHVEQHFGEAFHANNERMIANPDAGQEVTDGVTAFEGSTVETTLIRYRRAQEKTASKVLPGSLLQQAGSSKAK